MRPPAPLCLALVLVLGLAAPALAEPADISPEARAVLERAIESMGGDAALAAVTGMRIQAKGTYKAGPMDAPYAAETVYVAPDRLVWTLDAGGFQGSMGAAGDTAWSKFMGPPARVKGPMKEQFAAWLLTYRILLVRPLLHAEGAKITGGAAREVGGRRVHTVHLALPDGRTYDLHFDAGERTFLVGFEGDMVQWDGRRGRMKSTFSEPRAFGKITMPAKTMTVTYVGEELTETMKEEALAIEWNPTVLDDAFAMPEPEFEFGTASVKQVPPVQGVMLVHEGDPSGMSTTVTRLMNACREAGLMTAGAVNAVFVASPMEVEDPADVRIEVVVPIMVMGPAPENMPGGLKMVTLPAIEAATMKIRGAYGEADVGAWTRLSLWMEEKGHEASAPVRIVYFHDPKNIVEEDLISEVQIPIRKE